MTDERVSTCKTRQQIGEELLQRLLQREAECQIATEARALAQQRVLKALQAFIAFTLDGILPDDHMT
jgi:hypothetical protein